MQYKIEQCDNIKLLEEMIMLWLSQGWALQGGVSQTFVDYSFRSSADHGPIYPKQSYAQALIK